MQDLVIEAVLAAKLPSLLAGHASTASYHSSACSLAATRSPVVATPRQDRQCHVAWMHGKCGYLQDSLLSSSALTALSRAVQAAAGSHRLSRLKQAAPVMPAAMCMPLIRRTAALPFAVLRKATCSSVSASLSHEQRAAHQVLTSATAMLEQVIARGLKGMTSADAMVASRGVLGYRQRVIRQLLSEMVQ